MKLEDQCVSLDLAKRLKELGVKQESAFYWWGPTDANVLGDAREDEMWLGQEWETLDMDDEGRVFTIGQFVKHPDEFWNVYAAFTVAELGEMIEGARGIYCTAFADGDYLCYHNWDLMVDGDYAIHARTEADARAKMVQHLIENKIVPVEDINAQL